MTFDDNEEEEVIETQMSRMPQIWDSLDGEMYFTIGRGKKHYHVWKCGPCGLHYCYRIFKDGLGCRRAVEPLQKVYIHRIID